MHIAVSSICYKLAANINVSVSIYITHQQADLCSALGVLVPFEQKSH